MAAFNDEEQFSFLLGLWVEIPESSHVRAAHYAQRDEVLVLGFGPQGDTVTYYEYTGVTLAEAIDFARAESKGKWRSRVLPKSRANHHKLGTTRPV